MHEASFYKVVGAGNVRCELCPRHCTISDGRLGSCGVRENRSGKLYALTYALPCSMAIDPVEKKPLYHFLPGQKIFSVATVGCNMFCKWCQNHDISHPEGLQPGRTLPTAYAPYGEVPPERVVELCESEDCRLIAFTYTEPTIYYEYMLAVAKLCKEKGIRTVMVSNGYIEEEPLKKLIPFLDAANIDLKAFSEDTYMEWTKASLAAVQRTLKTLKESKVHLEITTLVVPGVNDSEEEAEKLYSWVVEELGEEQVVHISRFFPDYKVLEKEATPAETLALFERVAREKLQYVYVGNTGAGNETRCPSCGEVVIERRGYRTKNSLREGACSCGEKIPGVWS